MTTLHGGGLHGGAPANLHAFTSGKGYTPLSGRHKTARFDLARLLLDGDIASRQNGFAILQLSANNGYAPAQRRLAAMYFKGQGIQTDAIAAYQWISLAERSWPAATRADLVHEKARITNMLDANALAQAKSQIRNWRPLRN